MNRSFSQQAADAAYGWGRRQDWLEAFSLLAQAVRAEEEGAEQLQALVTQAPLDVMLAPPPPERLSGVCRIAAARGFAPAGFAEWMIERANGRLEAAAANDASGASVRTATTCAFGPDDRDLVTAILQERGARLLGVPVACHEPPNVIHYSPGQEYGMHVDFIEPSIPEFQHELRVLGQRVGTIVTYLNDDFDGAETYFPDAGVTFRGSPGDAIFFANVLTDGTPDYRTGHCARPPTRGEKWVLSQWIRAKPYPFGQFAKS
jgi:prolyl 4-hydroxylase